MRIWTSLLLFAVAAAAQVGRKAPIPPRPPVTAGEIAQGKRLFAGHCAGCHGPEGGGALGPNLARPHLSRAADPESLFLVIDLGIDGAEMPSGWQLHDREIWKIAAYVESLGQTEPEPPPGDAAAGKQIYYGKGNCAACHWNGGAGGVQGPDLSDVGERRSLAFLRESLADPAAAVPDGYLLVEAVKQDGGSISGVRLNEDPFTVQIRDAAGRFHSIDKADLKQLRKRKGESSMPSYRDLLTPGEIDDLVSYMASMRGTQ